MKATLPHDLESEAPNATRLLEALPTDQDDCGTCEGAGVCPALPWHPSAAANSGAPAATVSHLTPRFLRSTDHSAAAAHARIPGRRMCFAQEPSADDLYLMLGNCSDSDGSSMGWLPNQHQNVDWLGQ